MRILRQFWDLHADAEPPLRKWFKIAQGATWRSLTDVKQTYPHADGVQTDQGVTLTVFNIGGNKYRLVVRIRYEYELVNVRHVLTHDEYDRGKWKE
ncbi:MAG: type II toxin-antitoxin system HigB family toxin [Phycisphaerae bacterium]